MLLLPAGLLYIDRVLYSSVVVSPERVRRRTARHLFGKLFKRHLWPAVPPQLWLHPQDTV